MAKVHIYSSKAAPSCGYGNKSRELYKTEVELEDEEEIEDVLQTLEGDGHQINGVLGKRSEFETARTGKRPGR